MCFLKEYCGASRWKCQLFKVTMESYAFCGFAQHYKKCGHDKNAAEMQKRLHYVFNSRWILTRRNGRLSTSDSFDVLFILIKWLFYLFNDAIFHSMCTHTDFINKYLLSSASNINKIKHDLAYIWRPSEAMASSCNCTLKFKPCYMCFLLCEKRSCRLEGNKSCYTIKT